MAQRRNLRSISTPIILGAVSVPLSVALLVGWTLLLARNLSGEGGALAVWLLVLGTISFAVIVIVLVLLSLYLALQILEVRRQDSFIDSVTHELKSPLASLKLCLETLARSDLPTPKREELRTMMLEDVERLTSFIDDVLQASRLANAEKVGVTVTEIPLRELVEGIGERVRVRHKLAEGAITLEADADIVVRSDVAALEIVIKNLIDNAVKYSKPPARVSVRATMEGERVILEVEDAGIGIAPGDLKRVFQRFYRVESEEVRERKGTGLGLFVVSQLVRNLGGQIEATSAGEGKGTTMRVLLPSASMGEKAS